MCEIRVEGYIVNGGIGVRIIVRMQFETREGNLNHIDGIADGSGDIWCW